MSVLIAQFIEHVAATANVQQFKKGVELTSIGKIEQSIYFIRSGAVRAYFTEDGTEHTVRLGYTGNIITSLDSFLSGKSSEIAIETIRASEIQVFSKGEFLEFVYTSTAMQLAYTQLLESLIQQQLAREIDILISSPVERLKRVLQRSPMLFQEIPLKYIAAYLRMTPETLSRIRKS